MLKVEENCNTRHMNVQQQIATKVSLQKEINNRTDAKVKENQTQIKENTEQIYTIKNAEI